MKFTTRFCPTANGYLHLGHLYMAFVNEYEARHSGGKFTVRVDDNQEQWNLKLGPEKVSEYVEAIYDDLEWMGIEADDFVYQSEISQKADMLLAYFNRNVNLPIQKKFIEGNMPELPYTNADPYPYTRYLTAEKVIMDHMQGITFLIRGEDLLSEYSLYSYYCESWGLYSMRQVFLPRLQVCDGEEVGDVSKTIGNNSIQTLRENGVSAEEVRATLARACLKNPAGVWSIDNIKRHPVLHEHTVEVENGF